MYSNSCEGNETGIGEYDDLKDFLNQNGLSSIYSKLNSNDWTLKLLAEIEINDIPDLVKELGLPLLVKSKIKLAIRKLQNQPNNDERFVSKTNIDMDLEHKKAIAELNHKAHTVVDIQNQLKQINAKQIGEIDDYRKNYLRLIDENKELILNYFSEALDRYVELETNNVEKLLDEHAKESQNIIGLEEANSLLEHYCNKDTQIQQALNDEEEKQKERSNSVIKLKTSSLQIMSNDTRSKIDVILKSIKPINNKLKDIDGVSQELNIINSNLDNFKDKLLKVGDNISIQTQNNCNVDDDTNENNVNKFEKLDYIVSMFKSLLDSNNFTRKYIEFYKKSKNENGKHVLKMEDLENNNNNNQDDEKQQNDQNEENEENVNDKNNIVGENNEGQVEEAQPVENQEPEQPPPQNEAQQPVAPPQPNEQPKQPEQPQPEPQNQPQPQQAN